MATIKGQNLRILVGEDTTSLKCVAAATSGVIHMALELQEDTTKDTDDGWIVNTPVGISWDATVDAMVMIDATDTGGRQADSLVVGQVYTVRFSQTAGESGQHNRDAVSNALQYTGTAILTDLNITAQTQDIATYSAKFTGTGDLEPYTGA